MKTTDKETFCKVVNALSELIALHKREMHDESITMQEWKTAVKNGEKALENQPQKKLNS